MTTFEWLTIIGVPGVMVLVYELCGRFIFKKGRDKRNGDTTIKKGLQSLLMRDLMQDYRKYVSEGCIDILDKQIYEKMYLAYHNLGKNGVMDSMYEEVMALPTK